MSSQYKRIWGCPDSAAESLTVSLQISRNRMEMLNHNISYWETYPDKDPERNAMWLGQMRRGLSVSDSHMPRHREDVPAFCAEFPEHRGALWLMLELGRLEFMHSETHRLFTHWATGTPDTHTHRMMYGLAKGFKNRGKMGARR